MPLIRQTEVLEVEGIPGLLRACDRAGKDTKKFVRGAFKEVGDLVKVDWQGRYRPTDAKSALGLRTIVRRRGVSVEQSLRKTTGLHPEWGAWQMRHGGIPALEAKAPAVELAMENAIGKVADHFDDKP